MAIDIAQLSDLLVTTLRDLPRDDFEVAWDSQDFEASRIYSQKSRKIDGGTSVKRNIIFDEQGTAQYRRYYDTDAPAVDQVHFEIDEGWTQLSTNYSWDVLELMHQRNSAKGYIDLIRTRRVERLWGFAELLERQMWRTPANSTDTLVPKGVPYFLNFSNNAVTTSGFQGQTIRFQDGSTGTVASGIDAAVEAKWRNYSDVYTLIDNDFLRRLRRAFLVTNFRPPVFIPNAPGMNTPGPSKGLYTNQDNMVELQDLGDKRDDNTAPKDLANKALSVDISGVVFFNRVPMRYIPQLDSDQGTSFAPIYYVDWSKLQPIVHDGYWMVESKPMTSREQHTTLTVFTDAAHLNLCLNRRTAGFVLHTVTS